jgi:hypothetical protein
VVYSISANENDQVRTAIMGGPHPLPHLDPVRSGAGLGRETEGLGETEFRLEVLYWSVESPAHLRKCRADFVCTEYYPCRYGRCQSRKEYMLIQRIYFSIVKVGKQQLLCSTGLTT